MIFIIYDSGDGSILETIQTDDSLFVTGYEIPSGYAALEASRFPVAGEYVDVSAMPELAGDPVAVSDSYSLEALKAGATEQVERQHEEVAHKYLSAGSAKKLIYQRKAELMRDWYAAANPDAADPYYAMVKAEADATGQTLADLMAVIKNSAAEWEVLAGQLEAARMVAKTAINTAPDAATIDSILSSLDWGV